MTSDLADVAGTAQTRLGPALLAALAPVDDRHAAAAPWRCRLRAVLWWRPVSGRTAQALVDVLPEPSGEAGAPTVLAAVGAMVAYLDSPVGPYREVLGAVAWLRRGVPTGHVPFMAVDSLPSLVAGRREWALPKTACRFDAGPGGVPRAAEGPGWRVGAPVTSRPLPAVPAASAGTLRQVGPGGRVLATRVLAGGLVRPALVQASVDADADLASWLPAGRCPGAVVRGALRIGSPTVV